MMPAKNASATGRSVADHVVESTIETVTTPTCLLQSIGTLIIVYVAIRVMLSVWNNFRASVLVRYFPHVFGLDLKTFGSWAVVTGATDGIGKQFAIHLARQHGLNIVLISRSMEKLQHVAAEIELSATGIKTKCLAINFADESDIYGKIEAELRQLDIAILVNNVGVMGWVNEFTYFHETTRSRNYWDVIRVNCGAVTFMTQIVLPRMVEKKTGVIVNVSSSAGEKKGLPFASVYSATKAYITQFTRTLQTECRGSGVIIQALTPGAVATKMVGMKPSLAVCEADAYVQSAIATVGYQLQTNGCLQHNILGAFLVMFNLLPDYLQQLALINVAHDMKRSRQNSEPSEEYLKKRI